MATLFNNSQELEMSVTGFSTAPKTSSQHLLVVRWTKTDGDCMQDHVKPPATEDPTSVEHHCDEEVERRLQMNHLPGEWL